MPQLTASLATRSKGVFSRNMARRLNQLLAAESSARTTGAKVATDVTRSTWNSRTRKRPIAPPRPGRSSTGGKMADALVWRSQAGPGGQVTFDLARADAGAPHWIIQEIGSGERATLRSGGQTNPRGRPAKGATYVKTVAPQAGRYVPGTLAFSSSPRGSYSPPGTAKGQQLYLASGLRGGRYSVGFSIKNEIKGVHFVQAGGQAGYAQYQALLISAAKAAFGQKGP